jgi:hypothetical protein
MVVILVISVIVVIGGMAAANRLSSVRVRRRRQSIELFTSAISDHRVAPQPVRRARTTVDSSRLRPMSTPANVEVLADYRKARARHSRPPRVAAALPRNSRPQRPRPA